jgi:dTDP-glucose pyrophosphorylase
MKNWKDILVSRETPIIEALEIIDAGARQIAIVVNDDLQIIGTITDGDIRRGLLKGYSLQDPVHTIMNPYPTVASIYDTKDNILQLMKIRQLRAIPIVDEDGRIVQVETMDDLLLPEKRDNWVVLMAGGLGSRLRPLTSECPKPLLKVGNKPLLETILLNFIDQGFHKFFISVNYKAEMIRDYFGYGERWGVNIQYLHEKESLGTAGALSLLPEKPTSPLFVMNGDLLTKVNFNQMLDFHNKYKAQATMGVREYDHQVPYGVVKLEKHRLLGIEEKPIQSFFVNAGIYVLNPEAIDYIPKNQFFDMPSLFDNLVKEQQETIAFPIREYWLDIGRLADFERANMEYAEVFG